MIRQSSFAIDAALNIKYVCTYTYIWKIILQLFFSNFWCDNKLKTYKISS